jgi:hypothetical protein
LTPAEYTSLDWTYPDARPCQYTFYYPFRGAPFRRYEPTLLKPTLKGAPSYNALTGLRPTGVMGQPASAKLQ